MAARVEHAHECRRDADQEHVGKHHPQQPQHQLGLHIKLMHRQDEGKADHNQRHHHARGDDQPGNHRVGRAPHLNFAVGFFLFLEDGNEGRRQCAFAEQAAEQVGNRERELERPGHPAVPHEPRIDHLAHHAEQAAGQGGSGHRAGRLEHL